MRLRANSLDIFVLVAYFPPKTAKNSRDMSEAMIKWIGEQLRALGSRTVLVIGGDISDGIGLTRQPRSGGQWEEADNTGPHRQKEKA